MYEACEKNSDCQWYGGLAENFVFTQNVERKEKVHEEGDRGSIAQWL